MPIVNRSTVASFTERAPNSRTVEVSVIQKEGSDLPELEYSLDLGESQEQTYWVPHTYDSETALLDVWFDGRVFDSYETATAVHDALRSGGLTPQCSPDERILTDVDLDSVDISETLEVVSNTFDTASKLGEPDASVAEATMRVYHDMVTEHDVSREIRRDLRAHATDVVQTVYAAQHHATRTKQFMGRVHESDFASSHDEVYLQRVSQAIETLFDAYLTAWNASSQFVTAIQTAGENVGSDWADRQQDGYRDVFETGLEFMGHSIVHAYRQQPKLDAYLVQGRFDGAARIM